MAVAVAAVEVEDGRGGNGRSVITEGCCVCDFCDSGASTAGDSRPSVATEDSAVRRMEEVRLKASSQKRSSSEDTCRASSRQRWVVVVVLW